jgi:hypothetical protein
METGQAHMSECMASVFILVVSYAADCHSLRISKFAREFNKGFSKFACKFGKSKGFSKSRGSANSQREFSKFCKPSLSYCSAGNYCTSICMEVAQTSTRVSFRPVE